MRLPGTKGAEKCILGEDKGTYKVRLVCRSMWYGDPAGRVTWLKNRGVVRLGRLVQTMRSLKCHAKTFSPYPPKNGNSIMISSFSGHAIQTQCQALWIQQEILRCRTGQHSPPWMHTVWVLACNHLSSSFLIYQRGTP